MRFINHYNECTKLCTYPYLAFNNSAILDSRKTKWDGLFDRFGADEVVELKYDGNKDHFDLSGDGFEEKITFDESDDSISSGKITRWQLGAIFI